MSPDLPPAMPPPPFPPPSSRDNWWGRNWKWFVPVGCLGGLLLLIAFVATIASFIFGAMRSSGAYQLAMERAGADPRVAGALGSPLKPGFFTTGNIQSTTGGGGSADLAIPFTAPKGEGTVYAVAARTAGEWKFSSLVVQVKTTGERIDLLHGDGPLPAAPR